MAECNPVASPYKSDHTIDKIVKDGVPVEQKIALVKKYQSLVGGLLWLQRQSRPDIYADRRLLAQNSHDPSAGHYEAAKRVLAYLQGTPDRGIRFTQGGPPVYVNVAFPIDDGVYTDANWWPQDASHPKDGDMISISDAQSLLGHVVVNSPARTHVRTPMTQTPKATWGTKHPVVDQHPRLTQQRQPLNILKQVATFASRLGAKAVTNLL
jgi:hypothetical protein